MARFNMVGLDALEKEIARRASLLDDVAPEMLKAGTDVLVGHQKKAIKECAHIADGKPKVGLIDSRDLFDSIRAGKVKSGEDGYYQEVWPQGRDHKGVSNAKKGFVLEYGTSKIKATHWMSEAAEAAEEEVVDAMRNVWNKYAERE